MKITNTKTILMSFLLFFILSAGLPAMGAAEDSRFYKSEQQQVFDELITGIYSGTNDVAYAKMRFHELRTKRDVSYNDEAGILDAIIDRTAEQSLTLDEAEFYFRLLQDGKLMKYRQEAYRTESEQYKLELLSLLRQKLEFIEMDTPGLNELLISLNNYYDLVGLEYDDEYFKIKDLILLFNQGKLSAVEIAAAFDTMDEQLISNRELRMAQKQNQLEGDGSESQPAQGGGQQGTGINSSESSSQSSGSGAGSQNSSQSGNGPRK